MSEGAVRFVDTSVLIRYFTDDLPDQAEVAERIIENNDLLVNTVILLECSFVLTRLYGYPREKVVDALVEFLLRENVVMADLPKELVAAALLEARNSHRLSFGDLLVIASMRGAGVHEIYSFDKGFRAEGIVVLNS